MRKIIIGAVAASSLIGGSALAADAALAATPTSTSTTTITVTPPAPVKMWTHFTAPEKTAAKAKEDARQFVALAKKSGVKLNSTDTTPTLGANGWQVQFNYAAQKSLGSSDIDISNGTISDIPFESGSHTSIQFKTLKNAQHYLSIAESQLKSNPNTYVLDSASVTKNANGTYTYQVFYHTDKGAFWSGDPVMIAA